MAKAVKIQLAELTKPLRAISVKQGTTLGEFLKAKNRKYSSAVRVNGETENSSYELDNGDIVTVVGEVNGG